MVLMKVARDEARLCTSSSCWSDKNDTILSKNYTWEPWLFAVATQANGTAEKKTVSDNGDGVGTGKSNMTRKRAIELGLQKPLRLARKGFGESAAKRRTMWWLSWICTWLLQGMSLSALCTRRSSRKHCIHLWKLCIAEAFRTKWQAILSNLCNVYKS